MDMAWQEITFATSNEHERMLDEIHQIMYKTTRSKDTKWKVRYDILVALLLYVVVALVFICSFSVSYTPCLSFLLPLY
jgi:hypothetical protein